MLDNAFKNEVNHFCKVMNINFFKISGDCVEVHISNLIEPAASRLVRPVDPDHVRVLTEEFRRSSSQFVVLAGHVDDGIDTNILREPDCGVSVETLGGNHTRIALQYLNSANQLQNGMVKVCLYQGLSDDEALEVGFLHNKQAELSKKMSFMDQARLIKVSVLNCISELPLVLSPVYDPIKIHLYKVNQYIWWGLRDCFCPSIQFHINIQRLVL